MIMGYDGKGDGSYTHGNSFANSPGAPDWVRHSWELQQVFEARETFWRYV